MHDDLYLASEVDLGVIIGQIDQVQPDLLIADSVQTISSSSIDGIAGGTSQVREVASTLIRIAKDRALPVLIVGHVTKDGTIAGPRLLEHLVDVVCHFEGDRQTALRFVRALKNRFGPTDESGASTWAATASTRSPTRAASSCRRTPPRCPAPASPSHSRGVGRCRRGAALIVPSSAPQPRGS